jgi:ACT domain-containing protein
MVRRTYTPEQIINTLREAEIHINQSISIAAASRKIGITERTYYRWRKDVVYRAGESLEERLCRII